MSALSELRARLDARGVDHFDYHDVTEWGNGTFYATDVVCGFRLKDDKLVIRRVMTPAEAVESTLGRGTCKLPETRINHGSIEYNGTTEWRRCSECGEEVLAYPAHFCPNCGREVVQG